MGFYVWKFGYRKVLNPLAQKISWIDPDLVSFAALFTSMITALCLVFADQDRFLLLLVILTIFTRMTMNTIDGVMAIQRGKKTLVGEVVNALPDRFSDVFLMLGFVFSPLCRTDLAVLAMIMVFLVSYTGMLGKAVGVNWQHHGPLGKVERLILIMIFALMQYLWGTLTLFGLTMSFLSWGMIVFIILGPITIFNRLKGQLDEIKLKEWPRSPERAGLSKKVLVVYDSKTGNTKAAAQRIAEALSTTCQNVSEVPSNASPHLLILCTPNIRADASSGMINFIDRSHPAPRTLAVVVTYGAPLWGWPTALLAAQRIIRRLARPCLGRLMVKGFHAKFKTYPGHPNAADLDQCTLFAIGLEQKIFKEDDHGA